MRLSRKNLQRLVERYLLNEIKYDDVGFRKNDIIKIKDTSITKTFEISKVDKTTGKPEQPKEKNKANQLGLSTSARYKVITMFYLENSKDVQNVFIKKVNLNNLSSKELTKTDADYVFFGDACEHFEKVELPKPDKNKSSKRTSRNGLNVGDEVVFKNIKQHMYISERGDKPKYGKFYTSKDFGDLDDLEGSTAPEYLGIDNDVFKVVHIAQSGDVDAIYIGLPGAQMSQTEGKMEKAKYVVYDNPGDPVFDVLEPPVTDNKTSGGNDKGASVTKSSPATSTPSTSPAPESNTPDADHTSEDDAAQQVKPLGVMTDAVDESVEEEANKSEVASSWQQYIDYSDRTYPNSYVRGMSIGEAVKRAWIVFTEHERTDGKFKGKTGFFDWVRWYNNVRKTGKTGTSVTIGLLKNRKPFRPENPKKGIHLNPIEVIELIEQCIQGTVRTVNSSLADDLEADDATPAKSTSTPKVKKSSSPKTSSKSAKNNQIPTGPMSDDPSQEEAQRYVEAAKAITAKYNNSKDPDAPFKQMNDFAQIGFANYSSSDQTYIFKSQGGTQIILTPEGKKSMQESLSRGALYRKRYYGRY